MHYLVPGGREEVDCIFPRSIATAGHIGNQKVNLVLVHPVERRLKLGQHRDSVKHVAIVVRVIVIPGVTEVRIDVIQPVLSDDASPGLIVN